MKSSRLLLVLTAALFLAVPAFAADRFFELTGMVTWVDPNSEGTFDSETPNRPFDISFAGDMGYGIGANVFIGSSTSLDFTVSRVQPDVRLGGIVGDNSVEMIPITGVIQFHLINTDRLDIYVGGGGAYILFDQLDNADDLTALSLRSVDFEDDIGFVANAGVNIGLTKNLALKIDGKYVPLSTSANAVFVTGADSSTKVEINPVIFSAGLSLRF